MIIEHNGKKPSIHASAYIAPNVVVCGDVTIGENSCVLFGAALVADGGPVSIGTNCVIMENTVVRGTRRHPASIGNHVLVGPRSYLTGCTVGNCAFIATGSSIFNGAHIGKRAEVRINGVVHLKTVLPDDSLVPIGWIAVGNPAQILPPHEHEKIWSIQETLNFPGEIFGLARPPAGKTIMPELTVRYTKVLRKHKDDQILDE